MLKAITTAATGLEAQQANIERISADLANVNTDSYKKSSTEFQDLMYETIKEPGAQLGAGSQSPVGIQRGLGVKVGATHKQFEQGPARMTYNQFDMMIEGQGFFPIQLPDGQVGFSRHGAFHVDSKGILQQANGAKLIPQIIIPRSATSIVVSPQGEVKATMPNEGDIVIGQIQLVSFQNPEGLSAGGFGSYQPTQASGPPIQGMPGDSGLGHISQGALEGSNVNVANSMVDMISSQRAYEMNAKVMSTANEMLGATINVIK